MPAAFQQYSMYILIAVVFIAMMWYSNRSRKRMMEQQRKREEEMLEKLVPGAWVHTAVGFWGRFVDADGDVVVLETVDGTEMYWDRSMLREVGTEPPFASEGEVIDEGTPDEQPVLGLSPVNDDVIVANDEVIDEAQSSDENK
ncbi:preprotein translocase subunit YajC [Schaalia vaccimaxillae]|uniref:preprotein translocase subunit YajC n=1 Tax=Schaalia vaccimaxillae TaxID=183916 RepID=UPI0003B70A48|nr:preprotein translocase subunit YajC [Schaalia vaccimaxillae]